MSSTEAKPMSRFCQKRCSQTNGKLQPRFAISRIKTGPAGTLRCPAHVHSRQDTGAFGSPDRRAVVATGGHPWKHVAAAAALFCYVNAVARRRRTPRTLEALAYAPNERARTRAMARG